MKDYETTTAQRTTDPAFKATHITGNQVVVQLEDGAEVGVLDEVWARTPGNEYVKRSETTLEDYGSISGNSSWFHTQEGYLDVTRKSGPLMREHVYVPLRDVLAAGEDRIMIRRFVEEPPRIDSSDHETTRRDGPH
ncbi:MAG TPA: hypothetical protein VG815_18070 [Chloroflexota bacterium]|jgi:hypothetical protein|nr:hypothetical protein [Chloroflexota bacterium]